MDLTCDMPYLRSHITLAFTTNPKVIKKFDKHNKIDILRTKHNLKSCSTISTFLFHINFQTIKSCSKSGPYNFNQLQTTKAVLCVLVFKKYPKGNLHPSFYSRLEESNRIKVTTQYYNIVVKFKLYNVLASCFYLSYLKVQQL